MNHHQSRRRTALLASLAAGVFACAAPAQQAPNRPANNAANSASTSGSGMGVLRTGITTPSTTIKLGFSIRGVVGQVDVKDNDVVKAGQPIIKLDDTEERARLDFYRKRADTKLDVARATETYNVKKIDFERKTKVWTDLGKKPNSSEELEMRTAQAEMNIAQIEIDKAKHEGDVAAAEAEAQQALVNKMNKTSPIDGIVRTVIVKPGEQVDETKPVVEIVDLDPLYVEVTLIDRPSVERLKLGDKVNVRYQGTNEWREATVDRIDTSSDASAGTLPFRLSMPNPEMRLAGAKVEVQLPGDTTAADAR